MSDSAQARRQALLEALLQPESASAVTSGRIPRRTDSGSSPLSFAQQRLWFLDQMAPGTSLYNVPRTIRLRGPLNIAALESALTALVARHETLRTNFPSVNGSPVQQVKQPASFVLRVDDLANIINEGGVCLDDLSRAL